VSLRDTRGVTLVIATHDEQLAKRCDVIVAVRDGRIVGSE
jgi:predicted ABC-type transport system involved in lysophospholipase L1 biosynthesis ATPase subunit